MVIVKFTFSYIDLSKTAFAHKIFVMKGKSFGYVVKLTYVRTLLL